jgi:hypothetical protein
MPPDGRNRVPAPGLIQQSGTDVGGVGLAQMALLVDASSNQTV